MNNLTTTTTTNSFSRSSPFRFIFLYITTRAPSPSHTHTHTTSSLSEIKPTILLFLRFSAACGWASMLWPTCTPESMSLFIIMHTIHSFSVIKYIPKTLPCNPRCKTHFWNFHQVAIAQKTIRIILMICIPIPV